MVKRYAGTKTVVHLHWLWERGPAELRGVTLAASLCGKFNLTPKEVTSFLDDTNCPRCKELAAAQVSTLGKRYRSTEEGKPGKSS